MEDLGKFGMGAVKIYPEEEEADHIIYAIPLAPICFRDIIL